jgi:hypothetical protein
MVNKSICPNSLRKMGFSSFSKKTLGCWAGTYLQPLGVLQGYFTPLTALATLKKKT